MLRTSGVPREESTAQAVNAQCPWTEAVRACIHAGVPPSVDACFEQACADGARSIKLHVWCADCARELELRFWCSEAAGWFLGVRERLAEGRMWIFQRERERWVANR